MPWHMERRGDKVVVVKDSDGKVVGTHSDRRKAIAQLRALYASESINKARFASRSEAGRYAAEIRWKGHVKDDTGGYQTEAGRDAYRLLYTPDRENDPDFRLVGGYILYTNGSHFTKRSNLEPWMEIERETNDDEYVYVKAADIQFNNTFKRPINPLRPDEPHGFAEVFRAMEPDKGFPDDFEEADLTVNTSPKGSVLPAGTVRRWQKPYEGDGRGTPYCDLIGSAAWQMMGYEPYVDYDEERGYFRRQRGVGGRFPDEEQLDRDAKLILDAITKSKPQPVLWRGMSFEKLGGVPEVGQTFDIGLGSTSRDLVSAKRYSEANENGESLIVRIDAGSKGWSIPRHQNLYAHDQEVITSGRFRVKSVERVTMPAESGRSGERSWWESVKSSQPRWVQDYIEKKHFPTRDRLNTTKPRTYLVVGVEQTHVYDPNNGSWIPVGGK